MIDPVIFVVESEPKDLFQLVSKENIDELMSVFPRIRLHYVASYGLALFMCEAVDFMNSDIFELYLKYYLAICEYKNFGGLTSCSIDIFRK